MEAIYRTIKCMYCGGNFKLFTSENKEDVEALRDFVSKPIPEDEVWCIAMAKFLIHKEADLIYGICSECCDYMLGRILSKMINQRREILFRKFDKKKDLALCESDRGVMK